MIAMIRMGANRVVSKAFNSPALQTATEYAVHKCMVKYHIVIAVVKCIIDAPVITVPLAKFLRHEDGKYFLEKAKIEELYIKLTEAVNDKKNKEEDGLQTVRMEAVRSTRLSTVIPDG